MGIGTNEEGLYVAGHVSLPGRCRRLDRLDGPAVVWDGTDVLSASLDGPVAVHERHEPPSAMPVSGAGRHGCVRAGPLPASS
jgi:hypothetical protein